MMDRIERDSKKSDQEVTEEIYQMMCELQENNSHLESTLWIGACWSLLANTYKGSGFSYKQFIEESKQVLKHLKTRYEDEE